ncbi:hypothetical protein [Kocuria tytonis]|nr:hypothetical protein [Kocuria tytonis]
MAARYLDDDPEFALEHANAAVRKAGRISVVREAAGVAAYAAGDYALALKELRTHRRISGSQEHLPLMVDCQRALGRADKAMEEATSDAAAALDAEGRAELAMVVSGIHADAGEHDAALAALEIPQLDKNRGFVYSPKLFRAYAEALRAVGRDKESTTWERQAVVAEAAMGLGQFSEPEIVDLGDDLDEDEARRTVREVQRRHSAERPGDSGETGPGETVSGEQKPSDAEGAETTQTSAGAQPVEGSPSAAEPADAEALGHADLAGEVSPSELPGGDSAAVSHTAADDDSIAAGTSAPAVGGSGEETVRPAEDAPVAPPTEDSDGAADSGAADPERRDD